MNEKQIIVSAIEYIKDLFASDCGGHDAEHSLRVYRNAIRIADTEPQCDRFVVALAALLHDADDHKLFQTENNANARAFLATYPIRQEQIEAICQMINGISFSKNRGVRPQTLEGKIVQDADRLDAMGAIGIARTFAYGGSRGRRMHDPLRQDAQATIEHFYEKLLLLKDSMHTATGQRLAQQRDQYMREFLEQFYAEWNGER